MHKKKVESTNSCTNATNQTLHHTLHRINLPMPVITRSRLTAAAPAPRRSTVSTIPAAAANVEEDDDDDDDDDDDAAVVQAAAAAASASAAAATEFGRHPGLGFVAKAGLAGHVLRVGLARQPFHAVGIFSCLANSAAAAAAHTAMHGADGRRLRLRLRRDVGPAVPRGLLDQLRRFRPSLGPGLEDGLVQLGGVALVLGLDGRPRRDALGRQVLGALGVAPARHDLELLGRPGIHGDRPDERDVHSEGSVNAAALQAEHRAERNRGPLRILHPAVGAFVVARYRLDDGLVGRGHLHHGGGGCGY
mmetsp:Transcript_28701/g.83158  ORF Transcript_28701/g.83158 Transcript_28701/m.83158 type:complete len:305 (-) Transcript_28701:56-970(-)